MTWIVFSKDRTYQLDAMLSSLKENGRVSATDVFVLHKYENQNEKNLQKLLSLHKDVNFIKEENFKKQTIELVDGAKDHVAFATDDALVTREIDMVAVQKSLSHNSVLTYSCRMGLNIDYCYPLRKSQSIPNGNIIENTFYFNWKVSELDWNYPLSVDGHFFRKHFLKNLLNQIEFRNPNTLESAMANMARYVMQDVMCCAPLSRYFNVPHNVVQQEFKNRHGEITADALNEKFANTERVDVNKFHNFLNQSPHQEVPL